MKGLQFCLPIFTFKGGVRKRGLGLQFFLNVYEFEGFVPRQLLASVFKKAVNLRV
jgi:hypothetical protein